VAGPCIFDNNKHTYSLKKHDSRKVQSPWERKVQEIWNFCPSVKFISYPLRITHKTFIFTLTIKCSTQLTLNPNGNWKKKTIPFESWLKKNHIQSPHGINSELFFTHSKCTKLSLFLIRSKILSSHIIYLLEALSWVQLYFFHQNKRIYSNSHPSSTLFHYTWVTSFMHHKFS